MDSAATHPSSHGDTRACSGVTDTRNRQRPNDSNSRTHHRASTSTRGDRGHGRARHRLSAEFSKPWIDEVVRAADVGITMGSGDASPAFP